MFKLIKFTSIAFAFFIGSAVSFAGERSVTFDVKNMVCPVCAYTVKKNLERVAGVTKATVSLKDKTAVVVYDDAMVDVGVLVQATSKAGFPSVLKR